MHYYPFHIGDYRAGTIQLTQIERWVYRDLLDCLYDTEKPLPNDFDKACMMVGARSEEHREAVKIVLSQKFIETEDGFTNNRFLQELDKYQSKAERAKNANKKRWGHDKDLKSDLISNADQMQIRSQPITNNQEPITNNYKKIKDMVASHEAPSSLAKKATKGTRLQQDWEPTPEMIAFCAKEKPDLDPMVVAESFRDYWVAQPGQKGVKLDWLATWRNWVRNTNAKPFARAVHTSSTHDKFSGAI